MKKLKQEEFFEFPTRGLFIDDYSKLPKLTTDLEQAKSDIDIYGYCMLKGPTDRFTSTYSSGFHRTEIVDLVHAMGLTSALHSAHMP